MRWRGGRRSTNIEDRRGARSGSRVLGGGLGTIVLVLVALYFGVDPSFLIEGMQSSTGSSQSSGTTPTADDLQNDPLADMVRHDLVDGGDHAGAKLLPRFGVGIAVPPPASVRLAHDAA